MKFCKNYQDKVVMVGNGINGDHALAKTMSATGNLGKVSKVIGLSNNALGVIKQNALFRYMVAWYSLMTMSLLIKILGAYWIRVKTMSPTTVVGVSTTTNCLVSPIDAS